MSGQGFKEIKCSRELKSLVKLKDGMTASNVKQDYEENEHLL